MKQCDYCGGRGYWYTAPDGDPDGCGYCYGTGTIQKENPAKPPTP